MSLLVRNNYPTMANALIRQLVDGHDPKYGTGTMSCSIYDTAWVSMIAKTVDGQTQWLFPASFQHLLDHQQHDGGWQVNSLEYDGILNTLAALLALCRHIAQPRQIKEGLEDMEHRKSRAIYFLEAKLSSWNVESIPTQSNSRNLVTKLLQMLEQEGLEFFFPGRNLIVHAQGSESQLDKQRSVRSHMKTAAMHSLEGRIGEIDFNSLGQHKISGSMMASPASTAVYLMYSSTWDDEAEDYLSHVVSLGDGRSADGVPTKYPTTVFEITGAITTLLENGFTHKDLGIGTLGTAAKFLEDCLHLESGVTGFAPYVQPDADNTAKAISSLCLLGQPASPRGLMARFEGRDYFKTYDQDSSPSFTTNCHVLKALLDLLPGNREQISQIDKTVKFLCDCWWTTNGRIRDQSNISATYPIMLMVEAFMRLVDSWDRGYVPVPNDLVIRDKIIISLFQALTQILQTQNANGSWESGGCEVTSYAVISLTKLTSLSSAPSVRRQMTQAIERGRKFILQYFRTSSAPDHVWSGKVTSGSKVLYQSFVLAALQGSSHKKQAGPSIESHFEIPLAKVAIQTKYFARQTWFVDVPEWLIQACLIESHLMLPQIRDVRYAVFPSDSLLDDRYFESIPFAWIAANRAENRAIGAEFIYQMTILTVLGRQFENYMANVVSEAFSGCLFEVEDIVYSIFQELDIEDKDQCYCDGHSDGTVRSSTATIFSDVRSVLYRFISHILNHPYVLMASFNDQAHLRSELLSFLLSRVRQDSSDHASKTSTDQTPLPYSFAFLACLVGKQSSTGGVGLRRDFLDSPEQQYLAADLCRHMSVINFMSMNPDRQGATLFGPVLAPSHRSDNSFVSQYGQYTPSRSVSSASTSSSSYDDSISPVSPISSISSAAGGSPFEDIFPKPPTQRSILSPNHHIQETLQMARLIGHERRCLKFCVEGLIEAGINQQTINIIRLFVDFNELAEQIYRDPNIGSTHQPTTNLDESGQPCIFSPPPVPPKSPRGSVSAARAALALRPLTTKKPPHQSPQMQDSVNGDQWPQNPEQIGQAISSGPSERDWSWNRKPVIPARRGSRASSEVSRIESIMGEIDGIGLRREPKPAHQVQRRTTSESGPTHSQPTRVIGAQGHPINTSALDDKDVKLAEVRLETQQRIGRDTRRETSNLPQSKAMAEEIVQPKDTKGTGKSEVKRRATCPPEGAGWVKAPPPETLEGVEARARKLHRASRLGGPRWKAPF